MMAFTSSLLEDGCYRQAVEVGDGIQKLSDWDLNALRFDDPALNLDDPAPIYSIIYTC